MKPPKFWDSSTLDKILENGDDLYIRIVATHNAYQSCCLSSDDIPESVALVSRILH